MYIVSKEFIETLDNWLFKNEKKYAIELSKNKKDIPEMFKKPEPFLYRGMVVTSMDARNMLSNGLDFKDITSWTMDEKVAHSFIKDSKYKTTNKDGVGIIVKYKVPANKIILNIFNYVLFSGGLGLDDMSRDSAFKEQEVLVDPLKVPKSGVKVV